MPSDGQERTEEATPRRRQEARRKGTVAKSVELTNSVVLIALLLVLPWALSRMGSQMVEGTARGLSGIPQDASYSSVQSYLLAQIGPAALAFLPFVAVAMIVGLLANFVQVGFVVSGEALSPSLSKINPFTGLQRLFSARSGMEGFKAIVKSGLFMYLAWTVVSARWDELLNLAALPPMGAVGVVGSILQAILLRVAIAWLALAALDYWFQRKQTDKQLRMTKDEVRREFREMETSPELKQAMMQRRRRMGKGRVTDAVRDADVVITNPTHFAVALKYDREKMHAPQVVAKGMDYMALRIREMATEAKVPLVPNPPLARQLYKKCEVGDSVPRDMFQAVAEVLAHVYTTLKSVKK